MKVLLKEEVRKLGKRGDVVNVSDGYGANFLIPNKKAVLFTDAAQKEYQKELAEEARRDALDKKAAEELGKTLSGLTLTFEASAGRRGDMVGTISTTAIIKTLEKNNGIKLTKGQFLDKNLLVNGFGKTELPIELYKGSLGQVKATLHIVVNLKEKK